MVAFKALLQLNPICIHLKERVQSKGHGRIFCTNRLKRDLSCGKNKQRTSKSLQGKYKALFPVKNQHYARKNVSRIQIE